jgi:uncharacterized membrane protein
MGWTRRRWVLGFRLLLGGVGLLPWILVARRSALLEAVFSATCHRLPERSLVVGGVQMLVCSRCAGIYLGLLTGALLPAGRRVADHSNWIAGAVVLPMLLDVATQDLGLRPSWHPARLATGWLLGLGLTLVAVAQLQEWASGPGA